ncbi:hypothetical protein [Aeromicrobium sp. CTD01-1L150]|uniref:hypothetical protein n=1 Tax=Aeromicrobium sp. CTD01-1L150 TaxID=3341830 RepID=UPI0035BF55D0
MTDQLLNADGCECGHCVLASRRTVERGDALRVAERRSADLRAAEDFAEKRAHGALDAIRHNIDAGRA